MGSKKVFFASLILIFAMGCNKAATSSSTGGTSNSEDSSTSGAAASAVGGAIASSDSSGKMTLFKWSPSRDLFFKPAFAAGTCPTAATANGSGCTNSGNNIDLTYSSCTMGTGTATWSGTLEMSLASGAAISCGTFPAPTSTSLRRQFVSSAGVPGTANRTSSRGTVVVIDHSSTNLNNFDNQSIATTIGTGYGTKVTFDGSGKRSAVSVRQRIYVSNGLGFDHSVVGDITISESGTTRTASGTVTVYYNKVRVVGTSTFTNVTYNNTSCVPISGSISTSFAAGANVATTTLGSTMTGKSETLTFNSDNTATFVDFSGASSTVELTHCY